MDLSEKILKLLFEPKLKYKGMPVSMFGIPDLGIYKKQSLQNSLSKLSTNGYIKKSEEKIFITPEGEKFLKKKFENYKAFKNTFKKDSPKTLIIMYDIPQEEKKKRDWFRFQLKRFGYEMIQRSVWVGPAPLPKEFINYAKSLNLHQSIKTLRLAKPYTENSFEMK